MELYEKKTGSETVYKGRILNVRRDGVLLPGGKPALREVVEHPGGVAVLPLTENGDVIMVRQYRYPFSRVLLEIPAGKLDTGEEHEICGRRELLEETGYTAELMTYLGVIYTSPGFSDEVTHLYLAQSLRAGEARPDEDEFLEAERVSFSGLIDMIMADEVRDAKTVAAALKAKIFLGL